MPGFDGTGPLGQGPMTGRGRGFCVLKTSKTNPDSVHGLAGINSYPVGQTSGDLKVSVKEVIDMPFGNGTGPAGMGPMTGRAAGFCTGYSIRGYMNPFAGRAGFYRAGVPILRPQPAGFYGYGTAYSNFYGGWISRRFRRGFGFGRGFGRGRGGGRGRFGFWW